MKPSKEQIEVWVGQVLPGAPVVLPDDAKIAELAYAAGRKAGMEEAQQCCREMRAQFDAEAGLLQASGASYCIEAIDAAMEADI